jgi:hypothetical protein
MFPLRPTHQLSVRTRCLISLAAVLLTGLAAPTASAQSGVIAFRDECSQRLYAMRGDGSARIALPLPPLPQPTAEYRYWNSWILDVSTSGPLTVVYYVGISRLNQQTLTLVDFGLFAVQFNDVGGVLLPDTGSPVRLPLPADVGFVGVDPNKARSGSFSPVRDRLALVASSEAASVLMTARVVRDGSTSKITGLSDLVVVGDLYSLGLPDPTSPASKGFTGDVDYSPDGSSIVASIYYDLWLVHLSPANSIAGADLLTANTDGFAEWKPAYSPEGTRIAYTAGPIAASTGGVPLRETDIHSLALDTRAVTRVTTTSHKGKADFGRHNAMWRADGTAIGFSAFTSATPRHSPCSTLVNSELFLINADGSNGAAQITNTNGTSVEAWPKWGW